MSSLLHKCKSKSMVKKHDHSNLLQYKLKINCKKILIIVRIERWMEIDIKNKFFFQFTLLWQFDIYSMSMKRYFLYLLMKCFLCLLQKIIIILKEFVHIRSYQIYKKFEVTENSNTVLYMTTFEEKKNYLLL